MPHNKLLNLLCETGEFASRVDAKDYVTRYYSEAYCSKSSSSSSRSYTLPKIKSALQFLIDNFWFQQIFPNHKYSDSGPLFDYVFLFHCELK